MKQLLAKIRKLLHRHDPIECRCELTPADAPDTAIAPDGCGECYVFPGERHTWGCPTVSPAEFQAMWTARHGSAR